MSTLLYPRLTDTAALARRAELLALPYAQAAASFSFDHPAAYFAAVGGVRAPREKLQEVRSEVLEALDPWLRLARGDALNRNSRSDMDAPLGAALHKSMEIVPSDAAHDGTWSFLSLVLLPEVTLTRFPDGHVNRWLGRPRNALRRTWWRHHVLPDLLAPPDGVRPLGEDELVGLFERSTIGSDARLARALARRILAHEGGDRSAFARRLSRRVLAEMAFTEISVFDDDELGHFIDGAIEVRSGAERDLDLPPAESVAPSSGQTVEHSRGVRTPAEAIELTSVVEPSKSRLLGRLLSRKPQSDQGAEVGERFGQRASVAPAKPTD
jgi:hypothetical protein